MNKYRTYKIFDYEVIPESISEGYKPCHGCTIQVTVNLESVYPEVKRLSNWLFAHGAEDNEQIFIFRN